MSIKQRKRVSPFLLTVTALLGLAVVGCSTNDNPNGSQSGGTSTGQGNQDLEQFVKSVTVKTQPTKTKYVPGETIDLKGLTFDTVWSIYGEETEVPDMSYQDLDSYDKVATAGMSEVNCTIGGFTFKIAITVAATTDMYSSISFARVDGTSNTSVIKDVDFFQTYKVTAIGKEGNANQELTETDELTFKVKHDETEETVSVDKIFSFPGDIEVTVDWHGLSGKLSVHVVNGYMVYGKDMIKTADIKETDRNFLEKDEASSEMNVRTDAGVQYAGEIRQGYHLIFHVWSDTARDANVILYASSTVRTYWAGYPNSANQWKPTETAEIQFNTVFTATYGKDTKTDITIDDDIVLPGNESKLTKVEDCPTDFKTPDDKGRYYDDSIWVNWRMVNFGTIPLEAGDNIITLTNIKGNVVNVYGLEAQFAD